MNRRALIAALPAAVVAGTVPAEAAGDSPIAQIHREITRLQAIINDPAVSDKESDVVCVLMVKLADDLVDIPARDLGEMMLKFMGHTINGDHETDGCPYSDRLWAEARALVGAVR